MGFSPIGRISAFEARDLLSSLVGDDRLDISAIKNVPGNGDPLFDNVVLLMPMTTASGITDIKGKSITNSGVTNSTTILDPFGNNTGVLRFPGSGARLSVAQSNDFAFGGGSFAIDGWVYPIQVDPGSLLGLLDCRSTDSTDDGWLVGHNNLVSTSKQLGFSDFSFSPYPYPEYGTSDLVMNEWNYFCISRAGGFHSIWIDGVLSLVATTKNNNISAVGDLLIGDLINTTFPFNNGLNGYWSGLRITRAYRDGTIVPTSPFPTFK